MEGGMEHTIPRHIRLTSHPGDAGRSAVPTRWGAAVAAERGPKVASAADLRQRSAISSYSGAYPIYQRPQLRHGRLRGPPP
jgi:hypothetical protein